MKQDFRSYIEHVEATAPSQVKRITQEVSPRWETTALVLEYERMHQYPLLIFENIQGSSMPVIANVIASRKLLGIAMDCDERSLAQEFQRRIKNRLEPKVLREAPIQENVFVGSQVDLGRLPILTHFSIDGGPYITAGLVCTRDPISGANSLGYHRLQLKGKDKLGISVHGRRRAWEYFRRAEERGQNLQAAIIIGNHPVLSLGSMALLPYDQGKYELIGGLYGEPLEVVQGRTVDLFYPAGSEIVIEGEILAGVREPEGPFGEFTGYACLRSTENVFRVTAILHRDKPIYQSVTAGYSADHCTILSITREGDMLESLQRALPNIKAVCVPHSGTGIFTAYISLKKTAEGQGKQAIFNALGMDHGTKLVVVVDEDIDVFNESEVMWAVATRLQAGRGVQITPGAMGVILDPSSTDDGRSDKMGIDTTKPLAGFPARLSVPDEVKESIKRLL